jgi:hypothetical protein
MFAITNACSYAVRMSNAQTFSQLAEQLDAAVAAVDTTSLTADEAAELLPSFVTLQRHINTLVSFSEARTEADNVHFLDQRPHLSQLLQEANHAEEVVFSAGEFAMVSGDTFAPGGAEVVTNTYDDGRHFEWVGSQCVVTE